MWSWCLCSEQVHCSPEDSTVLQGPKECSCVSLNLCRICTEPWSTVDSTLVFFVQGAYGCIDCAELLAHFAKLLLACLWPGSIHEKALPCLPLHCFQIKACLKQEFSLQLPDLKERTFYPWIEKRWFFCNKNAPSPPPSLSQIEWKSCFKNLNHTNWVF